MLYATFLSPRCCPMDGMGRPYLQLRGNYCHVQRVSLKTAGWQRVREIITCAQCIAAKHDGNVLNRTTWLIGFFLRSSTLIASENRLARAMVGTYNPQCAGVVNISCRNIYALYTRRLSLKLSQLAPFIAPEPGAGEGRGHRCTRFRPQPPRSSPPRPLRPRCPVLNKDGGPACERRTGEKSNYIQHQRPGDTNTYVRQIWYTLHIMTDSPSQQHKK